MEACETHGTSSIDQFAAAWLLPVLLGDPLCSAVASARFDIPFHESIDCPRAGNRIVSMLKEGPPG